MMNFIALSFARQISGVSPSYFYKIEATQTPLEAILNENTPEFMIPAQTPLAETLMENSHCSEASKIYCLLCITLQLVYGHEMSFKVSFFTTELPTCVHIYLYIFLDIHICISLYTYT